MRELNLRIKILKQAARGFNPAEVQYHSKINDTLTSLKDDGLIRFKPNNIVNARMGIELTDKGIKRLDDMKRARYPDFLKWSAITGIVAFIVFLITGE